MEPSIARPKNDFDEVIDVVEKEVSGCPGKLLGYRTMHKRLRQEHELHLPRYLVHAVMQEVDPEGLEERCVGTRKRKGRGHIQLRGRTVYIH